VPLFQEYQRAHGINQISIERPLSAESEGDRFQVAQPPDTNSGRIARPSKTSSTKATDFKPPTGSWEDAVEKIDTCEREGGTVQIYLTWKGGQKTRHPAEQIYKRCPQKVRDRNPFPVQMYANWI
jgi:chromobox protein 1